MGKARGARDCASESERGSWRMESIAMLLVLKFQSHRDWIDLTLLGSGTNKRLGRRRDWETQRLGSVHLSLIDSKTGNTLGEAWGTRLIVLGEGTDERDKFT